MSIKPNCTFGYFLVFAFFIISSSHAQMLKLPDAGINFKCKAGRTIGNTEIEVNWNAPGVKGREGKIWGTSVAYFGYSVLGFGSNVESPWRAGADESTTISFSNEVSINGKKLAPGTYGFFIALYPDSCVLIFNKNTAGWGSYFYNEDLDVLRVPVIQQKNQKENKERLDYTFSNQTDHSVEMALEWERWRIPFLVEIDLIHQTLNSIKSQLSGAMGFDPPSLEAGAFWCYQNNVNLKEALEWINTAVDPNLGGINSFKALSTKAGILSKLGQKNEADKIIAGAIDLASPLELHAYGRQLLRENKTVEAMFAFEKNYKKNKGAWPTNVGMMRGYSAMGELTKALDHARSALKQAPNAENKKVLEDAIKTLESGQALK